MISPKGKVLAHTEPDTETVITQTLDYESLQHFREKLPVGKDWDPFSL